MKPFFHKVRYDPEIMRQAKANAAEGKALDVTLDVVFKSLLSGDNEDSRLARQSLLSSCIHRPVKDAKVQNPEILPEFLEGKTVRLDVHVTFNNNEQADIEMQMNNSGEDLKNRAIFYASRLVSGQGYKGQYYRGMKRVYQIFFFNFTYFPESEKFPRRYFFMEEKEHDKLSDFVEIIYYEIPHLEKTINLYLTGNRKLESLTPEEKWCAYFLCKRHEELKPVIEDLCRKETGIMRAERAIKKMNRDYEQWARALFREKADLDYRSGMYGARQSGIDEGRAEGHEDILALLDPGTAEQIRARLKQK
jgi:predicted transposase/invertase (TIGR01784 family)